MDPNAEPTPAELAAWRAVDIAAAEKWAAGRLERARRLGDVEIVQHLGNLLAAAARVAELDAENERLRAVLVDTLPLNAPGRVWDERARVALDAAAAGTTAEGESGACDCALGPDRGDGKARGFNPCPEHTAAGPRDFEG